MDCENIAGCAFFGECEKDPRKRLALRGFINIYCKGEKQMTCIRKKVSKSLGGGHTVPCNMMPNGMPLHGTSRDEWSEDVITVLQKNGMRIFRYH